MSARPRVLESVQRPHRYFLVPSGTPIPAGTFAVRTEAATTEHLKLGKLAPWEISAELAELMLLDRAQEAGQAAAKVLSAVLAALGADTDDRDKLLRRLARAGSDQPEHRRAVLDRIQRHRKRNDDPLVDAALEELTQRLRLKP